MISLLCAAAMLAGCAKMTAPENTADETSASVSAASDAASEKAEGTEASETVTASDNETELYIPKEKLGEAMASELFAGLIPDNGEIKVLSEEDSEKLEEAFKNIRINNSRFALPMMIMALPEGFSVKLDPDSKGEEAVTEDDFHMYMGELYWEDEMCADVAVILKDGAEEQYGIILGMAPLMSSTCKWSFGDIEYTNDIEKMTECFGEPSAQVDLSGLNSTIYISGIGSTVIFFDEFNAVFCLTLNTDDTIKNMLLTESVPYDDFDGIPEIPEVTGEPREIDWNGIFDEDCVIIGNERYPALTPISELGEDIFLFNYSIGINYYKNEDYLRDSYLLMYKGREIGMVNAFRKADEPKENGVINSWVFINDSLPEYLPAGMMGVPFSQDRASVGKVYTSYEQNDGSSYLRYKGITEKDGENYMCTLLLTSAAYLIVTPASVDPEAYESFLEAE